MLSSDTGCNSPPLPQRFLLLVKINLERFFVQIEIQAFSAFPPPDYPFPFFSIICFQPAPAEIIYASPGNILDVQSVGSCLATYLPASVESKSQLQNVRAQGEAVDLSDPLEKPRSRIRIICQHGYYRNIYVDKGSLFCSP